MRVKIFQHRIRRISCIFQALQKADGIQRVYAVTCSADSGINLCVSENRCLFSRSGKRPFSLDKAQFEQANRLLLKHRFISHPVAYDQFTTR